MTYEFVHLASTSFSSLRNVVHHLSLSVLPIGILRDDIRLSHTAKWLLTCLCDLSREQRSSPLSYPELEHQTGISAEHLQETLVHLERVGYIRIEQGKQSSHQDICLLVDVTFRAS